MQILPGIVNCFFFKSVTLKHPDKNTATWTSVQLLRNQKKNAGKRRGKELKQVGASTVTYRERRILFVEIPRHLRISDAQQGRVDRTGPHIFLHCDTAGTV